MLLVELSPNTTRKVHDQIIATARGSFDLPLTNRFPRGPGVGSPVATPFACVAFHRNLSDLTQVGLMIS
jgi:hypothetical protein